MHSSLEKKRRILEDLELLDYSITKRICLNPDIYQPVDYKSNGILESNKRIIPSNTVLQQHEIDQFLHKYEQQRMVLMNVLNDEDLSLSDLSIFKCDDDENIDKFIDRCLSVTEDLKMNEKEQNSHVRDHQIYDLFSCNDSYFNILNKKIEILEHPNFITTVNNLIGNNKKVKDKNFKIVYEKNRILSSFASNLKLSKLFSVNEFNGTQLDLRDFYNMWLSLPKYSNKNTIVTYKEYLKLIKIRNLNIKIDSIEYRCYLEMLLKYLENYKIKINPLKNDSSIGHDLDSDQQLKQKFKIINMNLADKSDKYTCLYCNKIFTNDSVYQIHLNSKKHKINLTKNNEIVKTECKIVDYLQNLLNSQFSLTLNEIERLELLTLRERELEKSDLKPSDTGEFSTIDIFYNYSLRSKHDNKDSNGANAGEEEEEDENVNPLNLPIGPDGRPMPFWLWKVKGLGHEFKCEICDNEIFKGRSNYLKHFKNETHIEGLKKIGINNNYQLFKDLNTKKEVLLLYNNLKKKQRNDIQFLDNVEQVEDDEGNIMNKKVYDQLQKQGLL